MPPSGSRRPPAPTCEDCWDEDTQDSHSDSRASANVAVKRSKSFDYDPKSVTEMSSKSVYEGKSADSSNDRKSNEGSDSGYSSKAGTSDSMSTASIKKNGNLKINTERERHPYAYAPSRSEGRSSPTKAKVVKADNTPTQPVPRFQHQRGLCWVCDQYGWHFDIEPEMQRPATVAPTQTQKVPKSPAPKTRSKEEGDVRPAAPRRSSSSKREQRPFSMYAAPGSYAFSPAVDYSHPMLAANGWQTPPNQMPQYPNYQYPYPPTPVSATYSQTPNFLEMLPMQYTHPIEPFYGNSPFGALDEQTRYKTTKQEGDVQRAASRESRHRAGTQRPKVSAQADRLSMPPPPKPEQARPAVKRAPTDYTSSRRQSVFVEEGDAHEIQAMIARERNGSQSRPPSAYKSPNHAEIYGRPRPRKSSSYSTPSGTVHIASSSQRDIPRRRTDPLEQSIPEAADYFAAKSHKRKEADAEAYVAKTKKQGEAELESYVSQNQGRRSVDLDDYTQDARKPAANPSLTVEALKKFELKNSSAMSDAGSVRSTHSSLKDSTTNRLRASTTLNPRTNITLDNGISFSIPADCGDMPLHIMVGNMQLSVNPNRDEELPRDLKRIERAPSEVSQQSRRSLTSGSVVSASKARDDHRAMPRQKQSANSSKRSSRAASATRGRGEVPSIDYGLLDESYYLDHGT